MNELDVIPQLQVFQVVSKSEVEEKSCNYCYFRVTKYSGPFSYGACVQCMSESGLGAVMYCTLLNVHVSLSGSSRCRHLNDCSRHVK